MVVKCSTKKVLKEQDPKWLKNGSKVAQKTNDAIPWAYRKTPKKQKDL